ERICRGAACDCCRPEQTRTLQSALSISCKHRCNSLCYSSLRRFSGGTKDTFIFSSLNVFTGDRCSLPQILLEVHILLSCFFLVCEARGSHSELALEQVLVELLDVHATMHERVERRAKLLEEVGEEILLCSLYGSEMCCSEASMSCMNCMK